MQHKKRLATNEMAIHIVLLTLFDMLRPTQSFTCSWRSLLTTTAPACPPARQGPSPGPLAARVTSAPLTRATTRAQCCMRRVQCVFCDDPDRPLTIGMPSPWVDPRCSACELHVLCSGPQKSSDAEIGRGERVGTQKLGHFPP
jgi:hypothetical protein